ncbi:LOW QUALITY PROTEIN: aminopeptidase N-like [Uranotaenia lowii]|uniref:LOW QUALITY PROTEIN: aminopeptidase N-like n=1 Tax=Uranotaenia lowii TaxID=190385 RepID=UPI002478EDC2|nr:LOW QUALITY PROTEIN: aminopeptidase N-like [Uranotaenia lowii]
MMGTVNREFLVFLLVLVHSLAAYSPLPEILKPSPRAEESGNVGTRDIDSSYFLPRNTIPYHYFIHLRTQIHENIRTFRATTEVYFEVIEPSYTVTMHVQELDISSVELYRVPTSGSAQLIESPTFTIDQRIEHITFTCTNQLQQGKYFLKVTYTGSMRNYQSGYLVSSYRNDANEVKYVGSTHFQATLARRVFPCYDEPDLKATIELWITHHKSYSATANTFLDSGGFDPEDSDYIISKFRKTPKMSTYLLAFAVTDFTIRSKNRQQVVVRKNAVNDALYALDAGDKILTALDQHIGVIYSDFMPRLTQIAIPDRGTGAMENWGLVTYGEPSMLFNPAVNTYRTLKRVTTVIAHEFAHQWFGNLVSPQWWDYIWLSEGFATLYEYYATALAYPELEYWELFNVEVVQRALRSDASDQIRAMNHPAASQDEVWRLFDVIAYQKSGSVLNMFHQIIGESYWKVGLKNYIDSRKLDSATPDDLYEALQKAIAGKSVIPASVTIKQLMESWTNAPGYPVLNVRRLYKTGEVIISQDRFLADKRLPTDHIWSIPYNYIDQGIANDVDEQIHWLTSRADKIFTNTPEDQWIIFNREQMGYYRVNYDERNWNLIIQTLLTNHRTIHRANRAQLLDDAFNLARADLLDMSLVLKMMRYLKHETDYVPWAAANNILNYLYAKLRGTPSHSAFVNFVTEIVSEVYKDFSVTQVSEDESTLHKYLRQTITHWACLVGHQGCLDETYEALKQEVNDQILVHPDVASVVYCHGLREGTYEELSYLLPKFAGSKNQAQRTDLIQAIGCSKDGQNIRAVLTVLQFSDVVYLSTERAQFIDAIVAGSQEGVEALIEYNLNEGSSTGLLNVLGEGTYKNMVVQLGSRVNNPTERSRLEQLLEALSGVISAETANEARAFANANAEWFNTLEGLVTVEFFEQFSNEVLA